jgi:hypothetical protein
MRVYMDGYIATRLELPASPVQNNADLFIGIKYDGGGNLNFDEPLTVSDLRIYNRRRSLSEIQRTAQLPYPDTEFEFDVQRRGSGIDGDRGIFGGYRSGPCYRYDDTKTDPHRLLVRNNSVSPSVVKLKTASTLSTDSADWTDAATDLFSGAPNSGSTEPSDYVYDGATYYIYAMDDTASDVVYFTGSDWTSLTYQGSVGIADQDVGSWIEPDDTTHLFAEDSDYQSGLSSNKMSHWVAPSPSGPFSEVETALDLTDKPWKGGDPDISEINGWYVMMLDNDTNHPFYGSASAISRDLYEWQLIAEDIKNGMGGDLTVERDGAGDLVGFCELSGGRTNNINQSGGIDIWDVCY